LGSFFTVGYSKDSFFNIIDSVKTNSLEGDGNVVASEDGLGGDFEGLDLDGFDNVFFGANVAVVGTGGDDTIEFAKVEDCGAVAFVDADDGAGTDAGEREAGEGVDETTEGETKVEELRTARVVGVGKTGDFGSFETGHLNVGTCWVSRSSSS